MSGHDEDFDECVCGHQRFEHVADGCTLYRWDGHPCACKGFRRFADDLLEGS